MADDLGNTRSKLVFRVGPDSDGQVYLSLDGVDGKRVAVRRPITQKTLGEARGVLADAILADLVKCGSEPAAQNANDNNLTEAQRDAQQEIDATLGPLRSGDLFRRAGRWVESRVTFLSFQVLIGLIVITMGYKGIQYSSENFPAALHVAVLLICAAALLLGILAIATEKNRQAWGPRIKKRFGPLGMLIFPCFILVTAAAVFGSGTSILYEHDSSLLSLSPGTPAEASISEPRLLDFYMWHFVDMVPFLSINEVLKWSEPVIYESSWIGFLVLLFQGVVVIPTIATIGYYWKSRRVPEMDPYRFVHSPAPPK